MVWETDLTLREVLEDGRYEAIMNIRQDTTRVLGEQSILPRL